MTKFNQGSILVCLSVCLLNTYDLNPAECIFVDDSKLNTEGARSAGIESYLFDGDSEKLRDYLNI